MVYRVNRDPIIDDNGVLRVDIIQPNNPISVSFLGFGADASHGYATGGNSNTIIDKFSFSVDEFFTIFGKNFRQI